MQTRLVASWSLHVQGDFHIGAWLVQPQLHTIARDGRTSHVEPKAMQVLVYLAEHADEVVPKERLITAVWADTFVTDDVLTRCISELRKAFDEDSKNPKIIETIPRSGYRLVAQVNGAKAEPAEKGQEPTRKWRVALAVAGGLVVLCALGIALDLGGLRGRLFRPALPMQIHSLAVLPLTNLSGDLEQEYFADGMTEELITDLAKISALRVISRTSVMNYKDAHKPLPQIGSELKVDAIVVGSVQRSGGRVRVAAELIEASTDRHLWADSYERDLRDVLALQNEVATAIAREIQVKLTPQERTNLGSVRPLSPEAHEAYLKGEYYWNKLTEKGINKSIEYYEKAIQLAPDYASAYASLAFSYNLMASSGYEPPRENYAQAKRLAQKALELDDGLAKAHAALGWVLCYGDWNWPAAEAEFKRAIELSPKADIGHHVYGYYLANMGRPEEAITEMKKALESDPLSLLALENLGFIYEQAGQPDKAIEQFRKVLEMDPHSSDARDGLGLVYAWQGRHEEAITELREAKRLSENDLGVIADLGYAYAVAGRRSEAHQMLSELSLLSRQKYVTPYSIAAVYAALGERDQSFHWLEKALGEHGSSLVALKVAPSFASLRTDPRFHEIVRRVGLPE